MYRDPVTHEHMPFRDDRRFVGTTFFASKNTHLGIEPSRRDDLESLGYVLLYFLRSANLPWHNLPKNTTTESSSSHDRRVMNIKITIPVAELCKDLPSEFRLYFEYILSLRFRDRPNYAYLKVGSDYGNATIVDLLLCPP